MANQTLRKRSILLGFIFFAVGIIVAVHFYRDWNIDSHPLLGEPAPQIEYTLENGHKTSLKENLGTVILINFWASWCEPCIEELPSLQALENHFKERGFLLLAFNLSETAEEIKGKISGNKMPRNVVFQFSKTKLRPYNVQGIPLSVLIDKKGIVRKVYSGARNWVSHEVLRDFDKYLSE